MPKTEIRRIESIERLTNSAEMRIGDAAGVVLLLFSAGFAWVSVSLYGLAPLPLACVGVLFLGAMAALLAESRRAEIATREAIERAQRRDEPMDDFQRYIWNGL